MLVLSSCNYFTPFNSQPKSFRKAEDTSSVD